MTDRSKARILIVPSAYYPSFGGVEEICRNLSRTLADMDYEVVVAVNRHPDDLPIVEKIDGLPVHRFQFKYPCRSWSSLGTVIEMLRWATDFIFFLRWWKPDLVHVICPSSSALYCWLGARLLGVKVALTFQGELFMDADQLYQRSSFARWALQRLIGASSAITACSAYVLSDAVTRFKVPRHLQRKVIFNGVDLSESSAGVDVDPDNRRYVLAVGRLVDNKGFDVLIAAFAQIAKKFPDLNLVLVGDGTARQALEKLVSDAGLRKRVVFTGRQEREQIARWFQRCEFFVLPSYVEPFGIVCLEAMRAGAAVIATDTGGPPEFIRHGENGLLVQPKDSRSLGAAMTVLLADEKVKERLARQGKIDVERFSWKEIACQYARLYHSICGQPRRTAYGAMPVHEQAQLESQLAAASGSIRQTRR